MQKKQHKTLARTLSFIGYHSPGEYGLFWDEDGTMPWKEFYWALREDPELRFVRESSIRELSLLGMEIPFSLDGSLLRICSGVTLPRYKAVEDAPARLYFGIKPKNLVRTQDLGLRPSGRPFTPLSASRELAIRIARRREPEPILIEVEARRAVESGTLFLSAGAELYLVESVSRDFLIFPRVRENIAEKLAARREKPASKPVAPTPGTFIVQPHHVQSTAMAGEKSVQHSKTRAGWKKESRKVRRKRDV